MFSLLFPLSLRADLLLGKSINLFGYLTDLALQVKIKLETENHRSHNVLLYYLLPISAVDESNLSLTRCF